MKRKIGDILIVIGVICIVFSIAFYSRNKKIENDSGQSVKRVLEELETYDFESSSEKIDPYSYEMKKVNIDGIDYIGYIEIPSIDMNLPVADKCDLEKLAIAPCRYSGSTKSDDLVIAGHNYVYQFGPINNLTVGDDVYFKDMEGRTYSYKVAEVTVLEPDEVKEMTSGEFELSLFTCNYSGQARHTVRCTRVGT